MTAITANGITIEYEDDGDPAAPPLLLVMGLGAQLTLWPIELVDALVARGFRVIRFDNRDIGLSTKFDRAGLPDLAQLMMAMMTGKVFAPPYTLSDMAADAVGLLDALRIPSAHVVGASMGGMIAQLIAADYPTRVRSLTSIMSTSGNPSLPPAKPEALAVLTGRPMTADRDTIVAHGIKSAQVIGSPAYPYDLDRLRARVERDFDRSFSPTGAMRQMAAVLADGDRRERLRRITAPTTVIHGDADPLVPVEGGRDTAAAIPGADLVILPGMGHDLPLPLIDDIADAIAATAARAR
ncbi:alpha/beta hydrolase [uncultured Sphingomonas sp.]|uniref:alpha/beta fold hydrolase n=1 Tax=uncultured Sphingomonas sp. TaxID=158754 RepID=UPI0025FD162B|nr:alpha/beta hydrolase [uncultured Sphingomonas sp.]